MFGGRHGTCTRIPVRDVCVIRRLGERDKPCRYSTMTGDEERSRRVVETEDSVFRVHNCNGDRLQVSVSPPTGKVGLLISSCAHRSKVSDTS